MHSTRSLATECVRSRAPLRQFVCLTISLVIFNAPPLPRAEFPRKACRLDRLYLFQPPLSPSGCRGSSYRANEIAESEIEAPWLGVLIDMNTASRNNPFLNVRSSVFCPVEARRNADALQRSAHPHHRHLLITDPRAIFRLGASHCNSIAKRGTCLPVTMRGTKKAWESTS
jgi:hypothetical protein